MAIRKIFRPGEGWFARGAARGDATRVRIERARRTRRGYVPTRPSRSPNLGSVDPSIPGARLRRSSKPDPSAAEATSAEAAGRGVGKSGRSPEEPSPVTAKGFRVRRRRLSRSRVRLSSRATRTSIEARIPDRECAARDSGRRLKRHVHPFSPSDLRKAWVGVGRDGDSPARARHERGSGRREGCDGRHREDAVLLSPVGHRAWTRQALVRCGVSATPYLTQPTIPTTIPC